MLKYLTEEEDKELWILISDWSSTDDLTSKWMRAKKTSEYVDALIEKRLEQTKK